MLSPFSCPALLHSHTSWPCAKGLRDQASGSAFHALPLGPQIGEGGLERRALGVGAPRLLLLEDLRASGFSQRVALKVQVLVLGGDARVADQHVRIVRRYRSPDNRNP